MIKIKNWNFSIILTIIFIVFGIFLYTLFDPVKSTELLSTLYRNAAVIFESTFQYGTLVLIAFLIIFALSPKGSKVISITGRDKYSYISWGFMIFTAGMGASILYWAPIEWAYYFNEPPTGIKNNDEMINNYAISYSNFHWGISGWALYCLPALAFAISLIKNPDNPLTFSGIFIGNVKKYKFLGWILDLIFIVSIISGAAIAIGLSFPLIAKIFSTIFNISFSINFQFMVLLLCLLIVAVTTALGLTKGIKKLSEFNIYLVIFLLGFILINGNTADLLNYSYVSLKTLFSNFFEMSTLTNDVFVQDWTVFYWAWWMALSPFVGTFVVNISNGKTLRELILGTVFIGAFGSMLHFLIIGNYSFYLFSNDIVNVIALISSGETNTAIVNIIGTLPFRNFILLVYAIVMIIFMCTTYNSCAYVLAASSMKTTSNEPDILLRILFSIVLMVLPGLFLVVDGFELTKNILLLSSIPLIFIFVAMIYFSIKNV